MSFVTRVHATFVNLDADANSLLSKEEFASYDGGNLTAAAADRVFQISRNYNHQLDYKAYLDFVLAVEYPLRRPSLKYLFRLLDVDQKGYLTTSDLHYFWRAMLVRRGRSFTGRRSKKGANGIVIVLHLRQLSSLVAP
jgi:serine/threonine-protein phosphatase 2A regulatory subunit B''